jgi:hypothetical protein
MPAALPIWVNLASPSDGYLGATSVSQAIDINIQ